MTGDIQTMAGKAVQVVGDTNTGDPLMQALGWLVVLSILALALFKPLRDMLRSDRRDSQSEVVDSAKIQAESTLYNHLADQVKQYREIADGAFRERNDLIARVAKLEEQTKVLEEYRITLDRMKAKLEEKDAEIRSLVAQAAEERKQFMTLLVTKDKEISRRDERILALEDRQKDLEIRIAKDEATLGLTQCPFVSKGAVSDPSLLPVPVAGAHDGEQT